MATVKLQYPDYQQKEMNGARCSFCKEESTGVAIRYTIYVKKDDLIPFRDPQKHELPVCTKHSKVGMLDRASMAAVSQRQLNPTAPAQHVADMKEVKSISPETYEKIKPIVLDFCPIIGENEIQAALTSSPDQTSLLDKNELKQRRDQARRGMVKWFIILPLVGIASLAFGIYFGFWIALCAGTVALTIAPIAFIMRYVEVGRPPKQRTALEVVETFYQEVEGSSGDLSEDDILMAFQLLSPTVARRSEANSPSSLRKAWNDVASKIDKSISQATHEKTGLGERAWGSRHKAAVTVSFPTDSTSEVVIEFWHLRQKGQFDSITGKSIGWAVTRFHNVAVRIAEKWYLMAGEPGEISSSR